MQVPPHVRCPQKYRNGHARSERHENAVTSRLLENYRRACQRRSRAKKYWLSRYNVTFGLPRYAFYHPARWLCAILVGLGFPEIAFAHVKWFANYDLLSPPRPALSVLSNHYFVLFCLFVVPLIFVVTVLDRYLTRRNCFLHRHASTLTDRLSDHFPTILRLGVSGFFASVFAYGCLHDWMILTPELHTRTTWVCWIQLGIAIAALLRRTAVFAGAGIVLLYGYAVISYGLFHMLDYPIFLGVAACLMIDSLHGREKGELANAVMRISAAVTLLWASIEKFAFPEWSFMLMATQPGMTLGFNPEFFMVAAGFVEFCAAFLLVTGMLSARAAAMVLLLFFLSAIVPFGVIDAIGHSVIVVVLILLTLSNNRVGHRLDTRFGLPATATLHAALFFSTLLLFIGLYYGGYYLSYQFAAS